MKLWDFAAIDDHELFKLQLEEYKLGCFNDHFVVLPHGFSEELPILSGARHLCRLKIPFFKSSQRLFIAILYRYFVSRISSFPEYEVVEIDGCGHLEPGTEALLSSVCNFLQWSEKEHIGGTNVFNSPYAIDYSSLVGLGEIGQLFKSILKRTNATAQFFLDNFMSEELVTSGALRSLGIASAVFEKWRSVLARGDLSSASEGGARFLLRLEKMLKSCSVGESLKKINYQSGNWPILLAATAGWLMRIGLINKNLGNNSSSVLCVVRSFEMMLQANAFACGAGEFSTSDGEFYISRRKISGCGVFVDLIDDRTIRSKLLLSDKDEWVIRARTVLSIRNHSRLAHGVLDLDKIGFDDFFIEVKALIKEFSDDNLAAEFEQTFADLCPPALKQRIREEIEKFLAGYVI